MIFFQSWQEVGRTLASAMLLYPFIVLSVRIAGKRSTSKMNNFDWIVTVALGSIVGSAVILKDVEMRSPVEVFLAGMQSIGAWSGLLGYGCPSLLTELTNAERRRRGLHSVAGSEAESGTPSER